MSAELLQACRGSVKADLMRYEQMILRCRVLPTTHALEAEANRLRALLDAIDAQPASSERVALSEEQMDKIYNDWRDRGDDVSYSDLMRDVEAACAGGWAKVPLFDEDLEILEAVRRELDEADRGNAPGHGHEVPGIWDYDNGAKAGKPCAWCLTWKKFTALIDARGDVLASGQIKEPAPGILPVKESDHGR